MSSHGCITLNKSSICFVVESCLNRMRSSEWNYIYNIWQSLEVELTADLYGFVGDVSECVKTFRVSF